MDAIDQDDEWYRLGQLGQHIVSANPDFDTRTYGKRKLSDLVTDMKVLEVKRGSNNLLMVRRIEEIVARGIGLGEREVAGKLRRIHPPI